MSRLRRLIYRLLAEQCGQDLAEYALLAILIAVAAAAAVGLFGDALAAFWTNHIVAAWPL